MVVQNEKKKHTFSASIGSFEVRTKNTFWGKSNYSNLRRSGYQLFRIETFQTVLTFLPTITCPITKFRTVCKTKHRSIHLSKISNPKYTHITVDVGAAEKYYKAIWINPDEFNEVIIYLGDFHDFMHFFSNCGKFGRSSGFDEILYQPRMCLVGGIVDYVLIRENTGQ